LNINKQLKVSNSISDDDNNINDISIPNSKISISKKTDVDNKSSINDSIKINNSKNVIIPG